jgi:precorrin-6B methylase 2
MSGQINKNIIRIIWKIVRKCGLGGLVITFYPKSALVQNGWFKSFRRGMPIDAAGNPIPWLPYSMIDFLDERLNKDLTLFEYGCGCSSIWYCSKVKQVTSVENNREWADKVEKMLPANGRVIFKENQDDFVRAIDEAGKVDVIVVDGIMARAECYKYAASFLTEHGIIIADDSERDDFRSSWQSLKKQGFKKITFTGITPSHFIKSQTSVLYRPNNCLGI